MTDPWGEPARPVQTSRCPWCSAEVRGDPVNCPSCGAALREETSADIPGVTQLDPAAGASSRPATRSRGLLGWLSGEYEGAEAAGEQASVAPPSQAVRAEMARLEMEAIQTQLDAQAAELAASAAEQSLRAAEQAAISDALIGDAAADAEPGPDDKEPGAPAT